ELIDLSLPDALELGYREGMARIDVPWQTEQANAHEQENQWFAAAFHWGQVAQHKPGAGQAWRVLETACARLGDWHFALPACDRLGQQDPTFAPLYCRRARVRAHLGQLHAAAADQLAGMVLVARNPVGWPSAAEGAVEVGDAYAERGDWPRACRAFAEAALW